MCIETHSRSAEETISFGQRIGGMLMPGVILCLFGDLGAGKTTVIKGIVQSLTGTRAEEVCSPTFSYLNIYEGRCPVYHFDLYRLAGEEDFFGMGFEEYFFSQGVCCLEWSERIASLLPKGVHRLTLKHMGEYLREIVYEVPRS
jgi:tRNA threonylcarbamoyladenosine biosynthesis protein TsaE